MSKFAILLRLLSSAVNMINGLHDSFEMTEKTIGRTVLISGHLLRYVAKGLQVRDGSLCMYPTRTKSGMHFYQSALSPNQSRRPV
jgi:hypothetical protein